MAGSFKLRKKSTRVVVSKSVKLSDGTSEKHKEVVAVEKPIKDKNEKVYFNRRRKGRNKKSGYKTGMFKSGKMNKLMHYRSAYEYAYYIKLEENPDVVSYTVEPFQIDYVDSDGSRRKYTPDLLVLHRTGKVELIEIKPLEMLKCVNVQRKAAAAVVFLKNNFNIGKFRFVTEEEIFKDEEEYKSILKRLR